MLFCRTAMCCVYVGRLEGGCWLRRLEDCVKEGQDPAVWQAAEVPKYKLHPKSRWPPDLQGGPAIRIEKSNF